MTVKSNPYSSLCYHVLSLEVFLTPSKGMQVWVSSWYSCELQPGKLMAARVPNCGHQSGFGRVLIISLQLTSISQPGLTYFSSSLATSVRCLYIMGKKSSSSQSRGGHAAHRRGGRSRGRGGSHYTHSRISAVQDGGRPDSAIDVVDDNREGDEEAGEEEEIQPKIDVPVAMWVRAMFCYLILS